MSRSETKYYPHPYLTSNGMIGYMYYTYPFPESKSMNVLGKAHSISIPRIYHKVINDELSPSTLFKKASRLHQMWENSLVTSNFHKTVHETVPGPRPLVSEELIETMDEHNRRIAKTVNEKGWEEGAMEMMKGLTYSEMRSRYG